MAIKIIKDEARTVAKVEGIDVNPIPLNSYVCGVDVATGGITIFNPNSPNEQGNPTKIFSNVHYTEFIKSDNSIPATAEELKEDIELQLTQPATDDEASYKGLWDASTNTPNIDSLPEAPKSGDFFYVQPAGTHNGVDYQINDRIQYNGASWDRIPAPENWDYLIADNSYDITHLNNRDFVDFYLTSNKTLVLPTLSSDDAGWMVTIVNSSTYRLTVTGTASGQRQLRLGGSVSLLFNGTGFVVLNYARSGSILSLTDFQNAAVNHQNTIYIDPSTATSAEDMDGSVLFPYNNLADAISNSSENDVIALKGVNEVSSEIVLPHSLIFKGSNDAEIKYSSYSESNGDILSFNGSGTESFEFYDIKFSNAGNYALYIRNVAETIIEDCVFTNNGWNGQGLNTVVDSATSGVLGYDSSSSELQAFYAGTNASNGGAMRIQDSKIVELISNEVYENLRGLRLQDCGIGGFGFVSRNQVYNNIESGIYLASSSYNANDGCQNFTVYNNASKYNANNGVLVIGGINNVISLNVIEGNWNAGIMGWHVSNTRFRDMDLTNNNRSAYNGIGNSGDAYSSIAIAGDTINPAASFIADVLDTQVYNTGLGSATERIGLNIASDVSDIDDLSKCLINIDDVGFKKQDYAVDVECDLDKVRLTLGDCRYIDTYQSNVRVSSGYYYELPFSNHHTTIKHLDLSLDNTTSQVILKEGLWGDVLNVYGINTLQAIAFNSSIRIILKGSKKIQLEVDVADVSINGVMVNSVLSIALTQLNDLFTNTSGFASGGGDPVVDFAMNSNDLTITLQSGQSYTVDVTTLGVDENKFVTSGALNGSNLELTMNDASVISIDASNMINGSQLPAISNDWFISYGGSAGEKIEAASIVGVYENKQPFYNGDFLEKGEEYVWTHDDNGYYVLGIYTGAEETSDEVEITYGAKWSNLFRFTTTGDNRVSETSVGVDVASRYATGYNITNNTVLALAYDTDNFLRLFDVSNGDRILIGQSNVALVGDSQVISFGGQNQPNAKFPLMVKRYSNWTIVHDFDNSETSISDGVEADTILRSNLSIGAGEKMLLNLNYFGRNESIGINYSGGNSGVNNAPTNINSRLFYNSAELLRAVSGSANGTIWTWNTSASKYYDPNGDGSNVGYLNGGGVNLGLISFRYQTNNVLELWHETNNEKIATLNTPLDGLDINIYVGFNEAHPYNRIPSISKQAIGQGSQPVTNFAPDISNQSFDITEGTSFNVQIALDANSDIANQFVEEDAPSWVVMNQSTGQLIGTAPAYNGSSDSYVINCKAANAVGGIVNFQVTLNVQEVTYTNTKSLNFADGVSSYLGGNAALVTALERSGTGAGSSDAWSIAFWFKGSSANTGQTLFYFGASDVVNNGNIEIKQTNHNGLKRIRFRYGSNSNHIQMTTPSGSINPNAWQHVLVTYDGGTTGSSSTNMASYYSRFKIYIDGSQQTTSNTHSNFGYNSSIVGQNYRFGRFSSGNYPKNILLNLLTIWDSDQSSNAAGIYNGGVTRDTLLLQAGVGNLNTNYLHPDHHYEIESSTSTIQDLIGNAHLVGYNFSTSDLVDDAP